MATLLETLAANETAQSPAMERFIETLTALVLQYEEEIDPRPAGSPRGVLKYLMKERGLRQVDLTPVPGGKSYVSQMLDLANQNASSVRSDRSPPAGNEGKRGLYGILSY
jgi:antitoxin component HigA of HigAB toxin-antitoxin module